MIAAYVGGSAGAVSVLVHVAPSCSTGLISTQQIPRVCERLIQRITRMG
jgi:hypothetical protein